MFLLILLPCLTNQVFLSEQLQRLVVELKGLRVGMITNPTGVDDDLVMASDKIGQYADVRKFFAPEHGLRGDKQAGVPIDDYVDPVTGIYVVSLYGSKKAPTVADLANIDVLVYYIRDVGTRFYTYIWTMSYCMEAAQQAGIQFIVVDVPNPLGRSVEGCRNDMDAGIIGRKFGSNLGLPPRYGLTIGELALFLNSEWLSTPTNLTLIPYSKSQYIWILPSPNMPTLSTARVYPGFGIFEGTDLSEGRGTTHPFEIIGSPSIQPEHLADQLNSLNISGVIFRPLYFTPTFSKHANVICGGVQIHVTNESTFKPIRTALLTLETIMKSYTITFNGMADKEVGVTGFSKVFGQIGTDQLLQDCKSDTDDFIRISKQYYIY